MRWAILTGDIVDSSDLTSDALDALMTALKALARDINDWEGVDKSVFSRRGGDGWQMAISSPSRAFRVTLLAQATLRMQDAATRIAVAEGEGHLPGGPTPDLNSAHGPAFQASGRLLEQLGSRRLLAHANGGPLHATYCLADHISQGWTEAQARALCLMLVPDAGPRRHAAKALGISRQAVDQALHAAGFPALTQAIKAIEEAVQND